MTTSSRSPETNTFCALAILAIIATSTIAIMEGNDPRSWITFALSATAALLALRRLGIWAGA